jgi:hypothetical protein
MAGDSGHAGRRQLAFANEESNPVFRSLALRLSGNRKREKGKDQASKE